ncbi:uncharacterized protein LOC117107792, partial [Anneissia japonica]|uniref:uncharacterized protein LOC117107792 n=1 Tax=Anneissia japonica TaxID=1529436 RepID=UPI001425AA50
MDGESQSDPVTVTSRTMIDSINCHYDAVCLLNINKTSGVCQCKDGFSGDGVTNCSAMFECSRKLQQKKKLVIVTYDVPDNRPQNTFFPGDELHYSCPFGYAMRRANKKVRTCKLNGSTPEWLPKLHPVCVGNYSIYIFNFFLIIFNVIMP